jgi:hypothetical protein
MNAKTGPVLEEDEDGYQLVKRYAVTWTVK